MPRALATGICLLVLTATTAWATEEGLMAYWRFDTAGQRIADLSGRHHDAALTGGRLVKRDGKPVLPEGSGVMMTADLWGDFRDELVLSTTTAEGKRAIAVVTAIHPVSSRYVTATDNLDYRLWLGRNMGGGYRSVYDRSLTPPSGDD